MDDILNHNKTKDSMDYCCECLMTSGGPKGATWMCEHLQATSVFGGHILAADDRLGGGEVLPACWGCDHQGGSSIPLLRRKLRQRLLLSGVMDENLCNALHSHPRPSASDTKIACRTQQESAESYWGRCGT